MSRNKTVSQSAPSSKESLGSHVSLSSSSSGASSSSALDARASVFATSTSDSARTTASQRWSNAELTLLEALMCKHGVSERSIIQYFLPRLPGRSLKAVLWRIWKLREENGLSEHTKELLESRRVVRRTPWTTDEERLLMDLMCECSTATEVKARAAVLLPRRTGFAINKKLNLLLKDLERSTDESLTTAETQAQAERAVSTQSASTSVSLSSESHSEPPPTHSQQYLDEQSYSSGSDDALLHLPLPSSPHTSLRFSPQCSASSLSELSRASSASTSSTASSAAIVSTASAHSSQSSSSAAAHSTSASTSGSSLGGPQSSSSSSKLTLHSQSLLLRPRHSQVWRSEEEELLVELLRKHGSKRVEEVFVPCLPARSAKAIRRKIDRLKRTGRMPEDAHARLASLPRWTQAELDTLRSALISHQISRPGQHISSALRTKLLALLPGRTLQSVLMAIPRLLLAEESSAAASRSTAEPQESSLTERESTVPRGRAVKLELDSQTHHGDRREHDDDSREHDDNSDDDDAAAAAAAARMRKSGRARKHGREPHDAASGAGAEHKMRQLQPTAKRLSHAQQYRKQETSATSASLLLRASGTESKPAAAVLAGGDEKLPKRWRAEELATLERLLLQHGGTNVIEKEFCPALPGRTAGAIRAKINDLMLSNRISPELVARIHESRFTRWSPAEEQLLIDLVQEHGFTTASCQLFSEAFPVRSLSSIDGKIKWLRKSGRLPATARQQRRDALQQFDGLRFELLQHSAPRLQFNQQAATELSSVPPSAQPSALLLPSQQQPHARNPPSSHSPPHDHTSSAQLPPRALPLPHRLQAPQRQQTNTPIDSLRAFEDENEFAGGLFPDSFESPLPLLTAQPPQPDHRRLGSSDEARITRSNSSRGNSGASTTSISVMKEAHQLGPKRKVVFRRAGRGGGGTSDNDSLSSSSSGDDNDEEEEDEEDDDDDDDDDDEQADRERGLDNLYDLAERAIRKPRKRLRMSSGSLARLAEEIVKDNEDAMLFFPDQGDDDEEED
eukprot:CAMPEP_0174231018 /NCGR_PEP_ID=MMETSP0417-20130205/1642_1 /TAXON_ID=242541 /ORGANISM="Mayorella sp, Strain BSH-02190019" /LENGTH=1021 /DNA_ID=CAMNT_0015308813 /DNA_START=167 /DNA_END=3229 /DNA_ORIENTATION=+